MPHIGEELPGRDAWAVSPSGDRWSRPEGARGAPKGVLEGNNLVVKWFKIPWVVLWWRARCCPTVGGLLDASPTLTVPHLPILSQQRAHKTPQTGGGDAFPRGHPEPGGDALSLSLQTRPESRPSCPWWSRGAGGKPSCSARWTATRPPTSPCCGAARPSPPPGAPPTPAPPSRLSPTPCGCGWWLWARGTRGSTSAQPTTASAPRAPPCSSRRAVSTALPPGLVPHGGRPREPRATPSARPFPPAQVSESRWSPLQKSPKVPRPP